MRLHRIDIYPKKRSDGCWIRNIVFNFPVPIGEKDIRELPLENSSILETVVLLSGEKVDGHIDIDLDVEKLEGRSGIATYAEIKAYIKGKYGFNVTSLYIGQIKDKVGIKGRKNYNTGSAKVRVPACPPEKEESIMDAFRHFGLI